MPLPVVPVSHLGAHSCPNCTTSIPAPYLRSRKAVQGLHGSAWFWISLAPIAVAIWGVSQQTAALISLSFPPLILLSLPFLLSNVSFTNKNKSILILKKNTTGAMAQQANLLSTVLASHTGASLHPSYSILYPVPCSSSWAVPPRET